MEEVSSEMRKAEFTWGRWTQLHDVVAGTYWVCCEAWYRRPEDEGPPPTLADRPSPYNPFSPVVETVRRKS